VLAAREIPDFGKVVPIASSTVEAPFSEVPTILEEIEYSFDEFRNY
jgi:hypothetical protein